MKLAFVIVSLFSAVCWAQKKSSFAIQAAFMQGTTLYASGVGARANASISLSGVNVGTADGSGRWSFSRAAYLPAADCIARISSGTSSASRAIVDCNFSAAKTPDSLSMRVISNPVYVGFDVCSVFVDVSPQPDPVYDPQNAILPVVTSGLPSQVTIEADAFSFSLFRCTYTFAPTYRTVGITATAGTKSVRENILLVPSLDNFVGTARSFSVAAQSQKLCRPNLADGQDATFNSRAIDDLREGAIGGGTTGVNPGTEFISAATLAARCSKSFPSGFSVVSTAAATASTTIEGAQKCVTARQSWTCNSGSSRNAIQHHFLDFLRFDNTIDAQVCLVHAAASGGVSIPLAFSGGLRGPTSLSIPAGQKCANYLVQYSGPGSTVATMGGFRYTATYQ